MSQPWSNTMRQTPSPSRRQIELKLAMTSTNGGQLLAKGQVGLDLGLSALEQGLSPLIYAGWAGTALIAGGAVVTGVLAMGKKSDADALANPAAPTQCHPRLAS